VEDSNMQVQETQNNQAPQRGSRDPEPNGGVAYWKAVGGGIESTEK
jgi:hypothetical protein